MFEVKLQLTKEKAAALMTSLAISSVHAKDDDIKKINEEVRGKLLMAEFAGHLAENEHSKGLSEAIDEITK